MLRILRPLLFPPRLALTALGGGAIAVAGGRPLTWLRGPATPDVEVADRTPTSRVSGALYPVDQA
jgi:hypothetical protein